MIRYLFAYGWLQRRFQRVSEVSAPIMDVSFVADGRTRGLLYRVGDYPGAIFNDSASGWVHGEVLLLNHPNLLTSLDDYEHAFPLVTDGPDYHRIVRPIETEKGTIMCWAYAFQKSTNGLSLISNGKF